MTRQRLQLRERDAHVSDLERYIDNLLAKVIDQQPLLLCSPCDNGHGAVFSLGSRPRAPPTTAAVGVLPRGNTDASSSPFARHFMTSSPATTARTRPQSAVYAAASTTSPTTSSSLSIHLPSNPFSSLRDRFLHKQQ